MPASARIRKGLLVAAVAPVAVLSIFNCGSAQAASVATWDKVAHCESTDDWHINTGNGYFGGLQILQSTWEGYGGKAYAPRADLATKEQQIRIAEKILAGQGAGAWGTCGASAGLAYDHADPFPDKPAEPVDAGMTSLTAGDFNGDGKKDLVAVEVSTGKLFSYAGQGNGRLGDRVEIGRGGWNGLKDLTSADFDKDGKDDLVATETGTGKLFLYKGNGHGLGDRVEIGRGGWNGLKDLFAGDFNGDGKKDVGATEISTGKLVLYPGTGTSDGLRALGDRVEIGDGGWNGMNKLVSPGDLDKDGKDDLIANEIGTGKLFLYSGSGNGVKSRVEIGRGGWNGISDIAGADFNGDGIGDMAAVESEPGSEGKLYFYPGTGTGRFGDRVEIGNGGW
ncbi:FG-GAP-like repeat-containing protein [Streptomyces griseocarneus]|uniref:FG-GAP-like repeat-containing protein n=1 Tax=Streptomyces griseocarneus TaxID=51201 RepID=UPI00167D145D|nr:FG-GAP-like repeat-containing protein [Streptomyces griseocarneus]GHG73632.1 hypothetical protein GCM10018779_49960 [Streptomyces griseocarneus]